MNLLYYGDCFTIMAEWPDACVDLVYLDPPLDSNRRYNAIYWDETGRPLPDRIEASCDRPELDEEREWAIRTLPVLMRDNGIEDATVEFWRLWMHASGNTQPQLLANLSYMMQRLLVMKRILKPTGSIYFHCDPTSSHYIKSRPRSPGPREHCHQTAPALPIEGDAWRTQTGGLPPPGTVEGRRSGRLLQ